MSTSVMLAAFFVYSPSAPLTCYSRVMDGEIGACGDSCAPMPCFSFRATKPAVARRQECVEAFPLCSPHLTEYKLYGSNH